MDSTQPSAEEMKEIESPQYAPNLKITIVD